MSRVEERAGQEIARVSKPPRGLSVLGRTTIVALLGNALTLLFQFLFVWLVGGQFLLPVLIFAIVTLIFAGIATTRMRWVSASGALVALITSMIMLIVPETDSALSHPAVSPGHFGTLVVLFTFALIAIVAGAAATIQNYRSAERIAPRWLSPMLTGLSGLAVGMIVVAVIVGTNPQGNPINATTNGMLTIHMSGSNFSTNVVLVPKGSKLLLVDDDSVEHIIENGSWTASGKPQTQAEPGAPTVRNLDIKGGLTEIGPFNTAGVFHLYCTVHKGMNLTVVVQ